MLFKSRFFKYVIGINLVLLIIFLLYNIGFLFKPVIEFVATLFFPILLAGVLYYVLRPVVRQLEKVPMPRSIAILLVYFVILVCFLIVMTYVGPLLVEQVSALTAQPSEKIQAVREKTSSIMNLLHLNYSTQEIKDALTSLLYKANEFISQNLVQALSTVTHFAVLIFITPFILYYFLKDDRTLYSYFITIIPVRYQKEAKMFLYDIDTTLSMFITGQLMVASILGLMLLIGYLLIGLHSAVLLALLAAVFITIPILGSLIAIIPALLVGLSDSPFMAFKVLVVMLSAQTLESNLITPQIMSQRLNIHPLILMLVLIASGSLYGVVGLFLATPVYAVLRVVIADAFSVYRHRQKIQEAKQEKPKRPKKLTGTPTPPAP